MAKLNTTLLAWSVGFAIGSIITKDIVFGCIAIAIMFINILISNRT